MKILPISHEAYNDCFFWFYKLKVFTEPNESWKIKLWSIFFIFFVVLYPNIATIYGLTTAETFRGFIQNTTVFIAVLVITIRFINVKWHQEKIMEIVVLFNEIKKHDEKDIVRKTQIFLRNMGRKCLKLISIFTGFYLVNENIFHKQTLYPHPVNLENEKLMSLMFILDGIRSVFLAVLWVHLQLIVFTMQASLAAHLECLCVKFSKIDGKSSRENLEKLHEIIQIHQKLKRIAKMIQDCFIYEQFFNTLLLKFGVCTLAYELSKTNFQEEPIFVLRQFLFILILLSSMLITNYWSQHVTTANSELMKAAYASLWYSQDMRFRKDFLLFLIYLNDYIKFRIPGIFNVDLESFVEICKTAYSLYAVLEQF